MLALWWWPGLADGSESVATVAPALVFTGEPLPVFCAPVYSDAYDHVLPTVSGGSWLDALPASNVSDDRLYVPARSTNLSLSSTQLRGDLQRTRTIGGIAVPKSNLSLAGLWRITLALTDAGLDSGGAYQSAWLPTWPAWVDPEDAHGLNVAHYHLCVDGDGHARTVTAQHWLIEWSDTGNIDGYLDIGRVMIAGTYTPSHGMSVGASLTIEDDSIITISRANTSVVRELPKRRAWQFTIAMQSEADAFGSAWDLQLRHGTTRQFFFVFDRNDPIGWKRSFVALFRTLSATEYSESLYLKHAYEVVEQL